MYLACVFVALCCFWCLGIYDMSRVTVRGWWRVITLGITYPIVYLGSFGLVMAFVPWAMIHPALILIGWPMLLSMLFKFGRALARWAAAEAGDDSPGAPQ
jgi:hypothetical protein